MSYCVNCGVELDRTAKKCPLCRTDVINPNCPVDETTPTPYPVEKGTVDPVSRKGISVFLSVVFIAIAIACLLLNLFLFNQEGFWSAYVMGGCLLLWILFVPPMILRVPVLLILILDGATVAFYLLVIATESNGRNWYFQLALPIVIAVTILISFYYYMTKHYKMSYLTKTAYIIGEVAALNVVIELAIRHMLEDRFYIRWSAVVLTCCMVVVIAIITVTKHSQLREQVRRRMHM